jgi:GAF domain-containing protein
MLKDDTLIGAIVIYRQEVRPFTDKQIELVRSFAAQAVIAIENTRLLNELRESLDRQTATSEVLQIINSSPGDVQPVFASILANTARICEANISTLFLAERGGYRAAAMHNATPGHVELRRREPVVTHADNPLLRVGVTKRTLVLADVFEDGAYRNDPQFRAFVQASGARSLLQVPLLKDKDVIGVLGIYRQEVRSFGDKQIALLENFADQAVIAIENARLLNELRQRTDDLTESLQQQTATSEVLGVISASPGELQPVFETMLDKATRICGAKLGALYLREADRFRAVAMHGVETELKSKLQGRLLRPAPNTIIGRLTQFRQTVHIADALAEPEFFETPEGFDGPQLAVQAGARTLLGVPMLKDNELIGGILIYQQEVRPFSDKQIELVRNFAAQAVIAIENTRLLNELRQSLEQQTATADVLRVISSSPGDLEPVFEVMLANAARVCDAKSGNIFRWDGEVFHHVAAHNAPAAFAEARRRSAIYPPDPVTPIGRVLSSKSVIHITDLAADEAYLEARHQRIVQAVELGGVRTALVVPMLKDGELIGAFTMNREEVRPFTDKQIALVRNFAAQAVIAIENTRLLNELRQSLEQQTATADVLRIISSSPGELQPVFDAILENATRICEAGFGTLFTYDGELLYLAAQFGTPPKLAEFQRRRGSFRPRPDSSLALVIKTKQIIHTHDNSAVVTGMAEELGGAQSTIRVPMLKDDAVIGAIVIYRKESRPFTDKQIELVQNFAAQAVIAIENTRLLNELRQSLEQQTATADVLRVISSSPGELEPVFQAMLKNATRICEAKFGVLQLHENGAFRVGAMHNAPAAFAQSIATRGAFYHPEPSSPLLRTRDGREVVQIADLAEDASYKNRYAGIVRLVEHAGARTLLNVPMLKDNDVVGVIAIYRQEVRPFTDKQIELVKNFAAQAVIAIENTRLLNELRQRTADLTEALEQQTATSEILSVISSSPGDLTPVFETLLGNATRLCQAKFGVMYRYENGLSRAIAWVGASEKLREYHRGAGATKPRDFFERALRTKKTTYSADMAVDLPDAPAAKFGGARSLIVVPMIKDDQAVGLIVIYRTEVRPFTDKQIALVENFAAQAVIAIENTRLLNELRQSLEQQTATAEVLKIISRSTFDLQAVLGTLVESAARLCRAERASILLPGDGAYHRAASYGFTAQFTEYLDRHPLAIDRGNIVGRVVLEGKTVQIADFQADPEFTKPELSVLGRTRTLLGVPMLRQGVPVGVLVLTRSAVEPFTENQIALVNTFADQGVIAIENVRLFEDVQKRTEELSDALEQQTATADVLKVISRSTFDLQAVLDTLTESVARLCEADVAAMHRQQGKNYQAVATFGSSTDHRNLILSRIPFEAGKGSVLGRTVLERRPIQVADVLADPDYAIHEVQKMVGFRTVLAVPLMREGNPIGAIVLMRLTVRPFTDKQIELVTTFADQAVIAIENVRLFEEIQDKSRQVEEASRHKSQFLANMSHELRTPLNAILGYTELIIDGIYGAAPDKMRTVLDRVQANGKHLLGLINDVLDLSKIEAGQLVLTIQDYSIKDIVQGVYSAVEPLASTKRLAFKIEVPPNLPPARGDDRRLTQVLMNLVGNAIKFTDAGEVAVKAAVANGAYTIAVRDTGPGIAEADQVKIFEEFQQADSSQTKAKGGTGLGLSIAKHIVEMHGGRLWVESSIGNGSTFSFTVPLRVERQAERS